MKETIASKPRYHGSTESKTSQFLRLVYAESTILITHYASGLVAHSLASQKNNYQYAQLKHQEHMRKVAKG